MLNTWYDKLSPMDADTGFDLAFWNQVFDVRDAVSKELENHRNAGHIKGGLTAEVALYANEALFKQLSKLEDELKFVLITSKAELRPSQEKPDTAVTTGLAGLDVSITASGYQRCDRCWHQVPSVGQHEAHPDLCQRCIDNIDGDGESRRFA